MSIIQSGKGGAWGVFPQFEPGEDCSSDDPYWFRGNLFSTAPQQQTRQVGNLVGGGLLPGGMIKTGVFSGGQATMPPALEGQFGWLLQAFAGAIGTSTELEPTTVNDEVWQHFFPDEADPDNNAPQTLLQLFRIIPTDGGNRGEIFQDHVVSRLQFRVTGMEIVTMVMDTLGKRPKFYDASGATTPWDITTNAAERQGSIPVANLPLDSAVQLPVGTNLGECQQIIVDLVNATPGLADVARVGSFDPHSWPVLNRIPSLTARMLYTDKELYESGFYDGAGDWNPQIYNTSFQLQSQSPRFIRASLDNDTITSGNLSYGTSEIGFTDDAQDFTDWEGVPASDAPYWIEVVNSDGSISWGYCGADDTLIKVEVYKDRGLTIRGWALDNSAGTPDSYNVFPCRRYELGFKAMNVDWSPTPPVLDGNNLMRMDFAGQCAQAESGLDWQLWLINTVATYTWPTS